MKTQEFKNVLEMLDSDDEANVHLGLTLLKNYPEEFENYFHLPINVGIEIISFLRFNSINSMSYHCAYHVYIGNVHFPFWKTDMSFSYIQEIRIVRNEYKFGHWKVLHGIPWLRTLEILDINETDIEHLALFSQLEELSLRNLTQYPKSINCLKNLKRLSLEFNCDGKGGIGNTEFGNKIHVPDEIGCHVNLESLQLSGAYCMNLPISIKNLTKLKRLNLKGNNLISLPDDIFVHLKKLEKLNLANNQLTVLPNSIKYLKRLKIFSVSDNKLVSLPSEIKLCKLRYLYLDRNQLTTLPDDISAFKDLRILNISNNRIQNIPKGFGNHPKLYWLYLGNNQIEKLPDDLSGLKKLKTFSLKNNRIKEIPLSFGELIDLRETDLSNNKIKSIPQCVFLLKKLKRLNLKNNEIAILPSVSQPSDLRELHIENNQLTTLPDDLSGLTRLKELDLTNNQIKNLPHSISQLESVTNLILNENFIETIPSEIEKLSKLYHLSIEDNPIKRLPSSIENLKKMRFLRITLENLIDIPKQIIELKTLKYLNYNDTKEIRPYLLKKRNFKKVLQLFKKSYDVAIFLLKNLYSDEFKLHFDMNIKEWWRVLALFIRPETRYLYSLDKDRVQAWDGRHFNEITHLTLSNQHTKYFEDFTKLTNLISVNLDYDPTLNERYYYPEIDQLSIQLDSIPKNIKNLKNLKELSVCNHRLQKIPDEILELQNLEILSFENNHITEIPVEITNLKNLKRLNLKGNNIKYVPQEVIEFLDNLEQFTIDNRLAYAHKKSREAAMLLPYNQRKEYIIKDRWVNYSVANNILDKMKDLLNNTSITNKPYLFIEGESNNGKNSILKEFQEQHQAYIRNEDSLLRAPVIHIQIKSTLSNKKFLDAMLWKMNAPYKKNDNVEKKKNQVYRILKQIKTKMILIDGFDMETMPMPRIIEFFDIIRFLNEICQISFVFAGGKKDFEMIKMDKESAKQFELVELPKWQYNQDYLELLTSLENILPLKNASDLASPDIAKTILAMGEGTIGGIVSVVKRAALQAIKNKTEQINQKDIQPFSK